MTKSNSLDTPEKAIKAFVNKTAYCVPDKVIKSTVVIVAARNAVIRQLGTGTLLAVADMKFMVTAAHVIREAQNLQATVGIAGTDNDSFTALTGTCLLSTAEDWNECDDPHDIAIYLLDSPQVSRLGNVAFVRIGDISFVSDLSKNLFILTGFPGIWSTDSTESDPTMKSKLLQYCTYTFSGSTSGLNNFSTTHHFLMEASPCQLVDQKGDFTSFRTRSGYPAYLHADLGGISGCGVWALGDLSIPVDDWVLDDCKLVGVETGVYQGCKAIKATRWNSVTTLIYNAYPSLRPVLELYQN